MSCTSYIKWIDSERSSVKDFEIPWASVERVRDLWLSQAMRSNLDREDAEDLFQDALLAALEGMDRLRIADSQEIEDAFIAWFWGILRYKRISYQRRRKRLQRIISDNQHQTLMPENKAVSDSRVHLSLGLFERQSPESAKVLRRRFLEGQQLDEMADEMGVSVPTACRRVKSALSEIRSCVEMVMA